MPPSCTGKSAGGSGCCRAVAFGGAAWAGSTNLSHFGVRGSKGRKSRADQMRINLCPSFMDHRNEIYERLIQVSEKSPPINRQRQRLLSLGDASTMHTHRAPVRHTAKQHLGFLSILRDTIHSRNAPGPTSFCRLQAPDWTAGKVTGEAGMG